MSIVLEPVGKVVSSRKEIIDDHWDEVDSYIELVESYSEESLRGLEDFSHVEIIFYMDQVDSSKIVSSARHPRNREDWPKVGIFAQRGKNRPNQLGLTVCEILRVEGRKLFVKGFDGINATPVLDIKPWVKEFGPRGTLKQPSWISSLMNQYWS